MRNFSIENIKDIITIMAILAAGFWTYYRFGMTREKYPKLQFDLDLHVLGETQGHFIVQLVAIVENKGLTRQYMQNFSFKLLRFSENMPLNCRDKSINYQLEFAGEGERRNWFDSDHQLFVDGGITHQFRYVTVLPLDTSYAMIHSKFYDKPRGLFKKSSDKYSIIKTFNLKVTLAS